VPTLYNLFGGKHAILLGELEEMLAVVTAAMREAGGAGCLERAVTACEAGTRELLGAPGYWRELVHLFLVSEETRAVRREHERQFVALMAALLREAQRAGELVRWIDAEAIAERLFAHYVVTMIQWAKGDLDGAGLRAATRLGLCLMLLGLSRGPAAAALARRVRLMRTEGRGERRARGRGAGG
jgi:AcrR family transcriptional regulator